MNKETSLGLVCAGAVSRTPLVRLPGLAEHLGPVKSASLRAASRACNNLKGGKPVEDFETIADCQSVLFSVPDDELEPALIGLRPVREDWSKRAILVLRCAPASPVLDQFRARGASIGWFDAVPGSQDKRFVAEADSQALRVLRKLIRRDGVELLEIARGSRAHFKAATTGLMCLHLPLLAASIELLKRCELPPALVSEIADQLLSKSSRSYMRSGKRPFSAAELEGISSHIPLETGERILAAAYERQLELTRAWLDPKSKPE